MNEKLPRTPLSTPLSGSARETELRLRNIFSGPKKRPPIPLLALMCAVCLLCGNLVSCQVIETETDTSAVQTALATPTFQGHSLSAGEVDELLQTLYQELDATHPLTAPMAPRLLTSMEGDGCILCAAFVECHLENILVLGVVDRETGELTSPVFWYSYENGVPNLVTYRQEGTDYLLYTLNGQMMGQYFGEAGLVRFDGRDINWEWPVEGDVRDQESAACQEYQDYWHGQSAHLVQLAPGGVDVYEVNRDFVWGADEPVSLWKMSHHEYFYRCDEESLPVPIYAQSLNWLNETNKDTGGWRIIALRPNEECSNPEEKTDCFTLQAQNDLAGEQMTADLFFRYETEPSQPRIYRGCSLHDDAAIKM